MNENNCAQKKERDPRSTHIEKTQKKTTSVKRKAKKTRKMDKRNEQILDTKANLLRSQLMSLMMIMLLHPSWRHQNI